MFEKKLFKGISLMRTNSIYSLYITLLWDRFENKIEKIG